VGAVDSRTLVLAGAILGAGLAVGVGLYFGLAARPLPAPVALPSVALSALPVAPATQLPQPRVAGPELRADTAARVVAALAAERQALAAECWAPSAARNKAPESLTFQLRFGFDLAGKLVFHAANDPADRTRAEVAQCLRERPFALQIPPPGLPVAVEVSLTLP
jgi:hypothetical protein